MKTRSGFTLIELLIVIAIIGVLVGFISSAVLRITRTAAEKRAANNAKVLQAAIFEYWHDNGKWPVGRDKPSKYVPTEKEKKDAGYKSIVTSKSEPEEREKLLENVHYFQLTYFEDNHKVVKNLIDAELPDGTRKTYLDLHGFAVPASKMTGSSVSDTVDAQQACDGEAVSADGKKVPKLTLGTTGYPLLWREAKTNEAYPFKIVIDYDNNIVSVTCSKQR